MIGRRRFLHAAAAAGLASLMPPLCLAAAPGDKRLVVIVLRGGMDGLDVVQPLGDRDFARLRPAAAAIAPSPAFAFGDFFGLHQALAPLKPLADARQFAALQAVSTSYRARSHFEAQDMLERGGGAETGWINRLIQALGSKSLDFAADIGAGSSLILRGPAPYLNLRPEEDLGFWQDSLQFLDLLYRDDPAFTAALANIVASAEESMAGENLDPGVSVRETSALAARLLREDCRIAAFSVYGWDTHAGQSAKLAKSLSTLATAIETLHQGLGPVWQDTVVVAVSEFGRTARFNGTKGTDHGTGGAALLAGGLLANGAGGKVITDGWPGLGDEALHEGRDLAPTADIRRSLGWLVSDLFGLSPGIAARDVFPGADLGDRVKLI